MEWVYGLPWNPQTAHGARVSGYPSALASRLTIEIEHPTGAEIQWDWFERRRAPWGGTAYAQPAPGGVAAADLSLRSALCARGLR